MDLQKGQIEPFLEVMEAMKTNTIIPHKTQEIVFYPLQTEMCPSTSLIVDIRNDAHVLLRLVSAAACFLGALQTIIKIWSVNNLYCSNNTT